MENKGVVIMRHNNFARSDMDTSLSINEGNTQNSFKSSDEKKALKRAKEAKRAFRESKGYEVDSFWSRCFKLLFKKKK